MKIKLNHTYLIASELTMDLQRRVMLVDSLYPNFVVRYVKFPKQVSPTATILEKICYKINKEKRIAYRVQFMDHQECILLQWQIMGEVIT